MGQVEAMCPLAEHSLAHGPEEVPLPIEYDERVLPPGKEVYVVLGVHGHAWAVHEAPTLGRHAPSVYVLVAEIAAAV